MTILSAIQDASARLVGDRPNAALTSDETIVVELVALAHEAAMDMAAAHDWQVLTEFHEIEADGETSAFPLPSDYDRMVLASDMFDPNGWAWNYHHVTDYGTWIRHLSSGFVLSPGAWMLRGNQFHFSPVPSDGQKAVFPYISNLLFVAESGEMKARAESDQDVFRLDERLLTLSLIWRWRQSKQMDYAEDLRSYETALSQRMARDRGGRSIRAKARNVPTNVHVGWPWPLGET